MRNNSQVFTLLPPFFDPHLFSTARPLLRRIEDEFGLEINSHSWKKTAFDHDVIIVNKKLVFRFPRTDEVKKRLSHEIDLLDFLKGKTKVRLPSYRYISGDRDFAGYKILDGVILRPPVFGRLSRANKRRVLIHLTDFVNFFHNIPLRDFKRYKPRKKQDFISDEKRIARELPKTLYPKLTRREVDAIRGHFKRACRLLNTQDKQCALHGDLYRENIIWDKARSEVGVIDFTDSLIGDPAKDFEVFFDYGKEVAQEAYDRYQGPKDDHFLERAEMYYKTHGVYTLLSTFYGARLSFKWARGYFRSKFDL